MAKKKTWDTVIKSALEMHMNKDQYAYFYGAKGQVLTDKTMTALWNAEPSYFKKYTSAQKKAIFDYSRGKIGYDCSGFIGAITGYKTSSTWQFKECTNKSADLASGVAGSILHMPGHIGIDIGYGYFLHFPSELHSCELGRIKDKKVAWTETGLLTSYINYEGANSK